MKKGNIVSLESYQDEFEDSSAEEQKSISSELEEAIQALIRKMREYGAPPSSSSIQ